MSISQFAAISCGLTIILAALPTYAQQHPVYDPGTPSTTYISYADECLKFSEAEVREMITEKAGFYEIQCPNCTGGHQGDQLSWDPAHPAQVKCKYCGMVFPNDKYPMDKVYEHQAPTGEMQQYPYYERADGFHHFFQAKIDYHARYWLADRAYYCALAYWLTKDTKYARRAVVILHRMAEVYPHLPIHGLDGYTFRRPMWADNEPPHPYLSQKLGSTWFYGEIHTGMVRAYDILYDSGEFEKLAAEVGVDVKQMVAKDLIEAMADFTLTFDRWIGNMTPSWCNKLIVAGRIVAKPNYVHEAVNMLRKTLNEQFFADGTWKEGAVSYHLQTAGGLRSAFSVAVGYSDPEGYSFPATGERFDDYDPFAAEAFLQKVTVGMAPVAYPDGMYCCVHDTWAGSKTEPAAKAKSTLLWSMGHACLESGTGPLAAEAQLHFSGAHGHAHADPLNLTYWAYGHELVSDLGYTHTIYRSYAGSAAAHNLVIVDETPPATGARAIPWAGELRLWHPHGDLAKAISVNVPQAYANCDLYQRTVVLIDRPAAPAYLVDFCDVRGGSQHDWLMRGSADHDQTASANVPLDKLDYTLLGPDRKLVPYINEGGYRLVAVGAECANDKPQEGAELQYNPYGLIRDLQRAETAGNFVATFEYIEPDKPRMALHLLAHADSEYYLATAPSIKRSNQDSTTVDEVRQPLVVARRQGAAGLESRFCALLWPYLQEAGLSSFAALTADGQVVGTEVRFGGYTDLIVAPPQKPEQPITIAEHELTTDAAFCLVRLQGGKLIAAELNNGTLLQFGGFKIATERPLTGEIVEASGGATVLKVANLSGNHKPTPGAPVYVQHADAAFSLLELKSVESRDGNTYLHVAEPPDFSVQGEKTQFHFYPIRTIEGRPQFRIDPCTTWQLRD